MTYASQQDLIDRFGTVEITELSDRDNVGAIDTAIVGRALTDADAVINGYVASRYSLPLSTVPAEINRLACDIARYLLAQRPTEEMRTRFEDARTWLTKVAEGKFGLGIASDPSAVPAAQTGGAVAITGGDRVFSRDTLADFADPSLGRQRGSYP